MFKNQFGNLSLTFTECTSIRYPFSLSRLFHHCFFISHPTVHSSHAFYSTVMSASALFPPCYFFLQYLHNFSGNHTHAPTFLYLSLSIHSDKTCIFRHNLYQLQLHLWFCLFSSLTTSTVCCLVLIRQEGSGPSLETINQYYRTAINQGSGLGWRLSSWYGDSKSECVRSRVSRGFEYVFVGKSRIRAARPSLCCSHSWGWPPRLLTQTPVNTLRVRATADNTTPGASQHPQPQTFNTLLLPVRGLDPHTAHITTWGERDVQPGGWESHGGRYLRWGWSWGAPVPLGTPRWPFGAANTAGGRRERPRSS